MNVNDITTALIRGKCCLDELTKVSFILKAISVRAPNYYFHCLIFQLFFQLIQNEATLVENLKKKKFQK